MEKIVGCMKENGGVFYFKQMQESSFFSTDREGNFFTTNGEGFFEIRSLGFTLRETFKSPIQLLE